MSSNDDNLEAPLLEQPVTATAPPALTPEQEQQRQKKHACLSFCGGLALLLVLLLTFLIPRSPLIELSGGEVGLSGVPLYVNASFRFTNRNFYKTTFSNLHFGLYTMTDFGNIGEASFAGPIEVKPRGHKIINVGIATPKGTGLNIQKYCSTHPNILMYLANATVEATSTHKDFGTMGVFAPFGAFFMCPEKPDDGN